MSAAAYTETIPLAAGEGATIESAGRVSIRLANGAADIAGKMLSADEIFAIRSGRRGVVVYSLDGGTLVATATAPMRVTRSASQLPSLLPVARAVVRLAPGSRVAVIGKRCAGKTLAARTIVNLLFRDSLTNKRSPFETVTLISADAGAVGCDGVAPGCVCAARITRPGIGGGAPLIEEVQVNFFRAWSGGGDGDATASSPFPQSSAHSRARALAEASSQSLHWLAQAVSSTGNVLGSHATITVVDAEGPPPADVVAAGAASGADAALPSAASTAVAAAENHFTNIVDIVEPQLVVYVGGDRNDAEVLGIEKMIQRTASATHSAVTFMHVPNLLAGANASASATSASGIAFLQHLTAVMNGPLTIADKIEDYFCGPAAFPMRCARIVVPLNKVVLLGVARGVGGDGGIGAAAQQFRAVRIDPARHARDLVGRICAVSLATVEAEAAFANVAGVVLIDSVHVPENELVLFVPAGGDGASDTCLVRPFLLVGDESLRYSGAAVEACSV